MDIVNNIANDGVKETTMTVSIERRPRGKFWRAAGIAMVLGGAMAMASCHSKVTEGRSSVYLIMDALEGGKGQSGRVSEFFSTLESDVLTNNSVFEDPGRVSLRVAFKDVTVTTAPTTNNAVTINRYRVVYRRTDGRNTQGVDVPYAYEGASTFTVTEGGASAGFVLVRVQAKLERPLITLVSPAGGQLIISTIADVTFYGFDQTGTEVQITGSISVNFADWGDPDTQ